MNKKDNTIRLLAPASRNKDTLEDLGARLALVGQSLKQETDTQCPDPELLAALGQGTLSPEQRKPILAHLRSCMDCYSAWLETEAHVGSQTGSGNAKVVPFHRRVMKDKKFWGAAGSFAIAASLLFMFTIYGGNTPDGPGLDTTPGTEVAKTSGKVHDRNLTGKPVTPPVPHGVTYVAEADEQEKARSIWPEPPLRKPLTPPAPPGATYVADSCEVDAFGAGISAANVALSDDTEFQLLSKAMNGSEYETMEGADDFFAATPSAPYFWLAQWSVWTRTACIDFGPNREDFWRNQSHTVSRLKQAFIDLDLRGPEAGLALNTLNSVQGNIDLIVSRQNADQACQDILKQLEKLEADLGR